MPTKIPASMAGISDGLHDLSRVIGELQAKVGGLHDRLMEEADGASTHRAAVRIEISALSSSVARLVDEVREIAPLVDDYRDKRSQAKGAARLLKVLWGIGAAFALAASAAFGWLMNHLHLRP